MTYKFKDWKTHSSTGEPVTDEQRRQRAEEIAAKLCDHGLWKTHGRSIKIDDLRQMRLKITDYSTEPELRDAIRRYHTLAQMTLSTQVYKIYETKASQILKMEAVQTNQVFMPIALPPGTQPVGQPAAADNATMPLTCNKCGTAFVIQARLTQKTPVNKSAIQFPTNNLLKCPGQGCDVIHDLAAIRQQVEAQTKKKIL